MNHAICPACKKTIQLQEATRIQDLITCPHCQSLLEFVQDFPPTLDWAEDPAICLSRRIFTKMY